MMWSTVEELEARVGEQVRTRRLRANRSATDVAQEAGVSAKTVWNLEHGRGSSLTTLIKVLRVLEAEDWLAGLAPNELVSPISVLESSQTRPGQRRRARRTDA